MKDYVNPLLLLIIIALLSWKVSVGIETPSQVEVWLLTLCVSGFIVNGLLSFAQAFSRRKAMMSIIWSMVYLIREHIGEGVTYINAAGETVEVTNTMIRKAIISMRRDALEENLDALQSPYALYLDWFAREGVAG